jgi:chromate transporter
MSSNNKLIEVAKVFFKLGLIAFGGPAAHISMMEEEVVTKRKWMTSAHFLDLVGATNLIPGPNSTEMTMHCGYERAGWKGLFVAGLAFIIPAVFMTGTLAYFYVTYGEIPDVAPFLYGIKPAVMAIILGALLKLGKKALKGWQLGVIGALVVTASFFGVNEVTSILCAGLVGMVWFGRGGEGSIKSFAPILLLQTTPILVKKAGLGKLFFVFLKIGVVLFGSGYVLIAYLDGELVENLGWLTKPELLDAIAIGQFTPGPVLSTATFVGYQIDGYWGAILATLGIFLPSFLFVLLLNPIIPKLRKSKLTRGFLDAVNIASLGIMAAVTLQLGYDVLIDWKSVAIAIIATGVTLGLKKVSSFWVVIGGSVVGYLLLFI